MLELVKECFDNNVDESCYEHLDAISFEIYDCPDTSRCFISLEGQDDLLTFKVFNPLVKSIYFFAIDRCLIPAQGQERCDFIVANDNTICFVEIKGPLEGNNISKRRRKALYFRSLYVCK